MIVLVVMCFFNKTIEMLMFMNVQIGRKTIWM